MTDLAQTIEALKRTLGIQYLANEVTVSRQALVDLVKGYEELKKEYDRVDSAYSEKLWEKR